MSAVTPLATLLESVAHGVARPASESVAPRLRLRCSGRAAMAYTFKDDGGRMTYYREYNKEVLDKNDTLVGNWVEERALREQIGTGRYALWVNTGDEKSVATNKQQTFTKFTTRPDALDTFSRTLAHSDHTPSAEYPQAGGHGGRPRQRQHHAATPATTMSQGALPAPSS